MNNRDYVKWKPFNSVINVKELVTKGEKIEYPELSKDEISIYEEMLKESLYLKKDLLITYIKDGKKLKIRDYVIKLDPYKKNVVLKSTTINFRQIVNIKSA